jgi:parvulin-like peptidyl-prolyl isomerase
MSSFLLINEVPIPPEQMFNYLQAAGQLQPFLLEILRQHAIAQELQANSDLLPTPEQIDQILDNFRKANELQEPKTFQTWMTHNNIDYETLRERIARDRALQQLILKKSEPKLGEVFMNRKLELDQVLLSCIAVDTEARAHEFRDQIEQDGASFAALAQDYSLADNHQNGGRMEPISRGKLPDDLRAEIDTKQPGDLIGPLLIDDYWYLFRLDEAAEALLEGNLEEQLRAELFGQWLANEVDAMTVKLQVTKWLSLKTSTR